MKKIFTWKCDNLDENQAIQIVKKIFDRPGFYVSNQGKKIDWSIRPVSELILSNLKLYEEFDTNQFTDIYQPEPFTLRWCHPDRSVTLYCTDETIFACNIVVETENNDLSPNDFFDCISKIMVINNSGVIL